MVSHFSLLPPPFPFEFIFKLFFFKAGTPTSVTWQSRCIGSSMRSGPTPWWWRRFTVTNLRLKTGGSPLCSPFSFHAVSSFIEAARVQGATNTLCPSRFPSSSSIKNSIRLVRWSEVISGFRCHSSPACARPLVHCDRNHRSKSKVELADVEPSSRKGASVTRGRIGLGVCGIASGKGLRLHFID